MGVEDEYGPNVPASRVLAEKKPLNFILEEPTHLKYIDASLALHAALGELLVREATANKILLSRAVVTALGVQHYVTIINKTECKYTSDTMP